MFGVEAACLHLAHRHRLAINDCRQPALEPLELTCSAAQVGVAACVLRLRRAETLGESTGAAAACSGNSLLAVGGLVGVLVGVLAVAVLTGGDARGVRASREGGGGGEEKHACRDVLPITGLPTTGRGAPADSRVARLSSRA